MSNGKPDLVMIAVSDTLRQFVEHMNEAIAYAAALPLEAIRGRIEVAKKKGLFDGDVGGKSLDMLMIRVQCAEEFKRVAEEHNRMLKARLEVDG